MALEKYFADLLQKVENSDIQNDGKDDGGFFEPTRAVLIQRISLLRDLHSKPNARIMVRSAWQYVVKKLPPEWLILNDDEKNELKKILTD